MTTHLHSQDDLDAALGSLAVSDPRLAPLLALTGMPALRRRPPGFAGLVSTICGQQLSTHAAAAIWARIEAAFQPLDAAAIRNARSDRLARLGLSAAKIRTLKAIATELIAERLDLNALGEAPADEAHARLVALHGIGPWTADIYLLFCLGHGDAWPAGDLALQEAIRIAFALSERPDTKRTQVIAEAWRPWRGAAAHLFWAYYRVAKAPGFSATPALQHAAGPRAAPPPAKRKRSKTPAKEGKGARVPSRKTARRTTAKGEPKSGGGRRSVPRAKR